MKKRNLISLILCLLLLLSLAGCNSSNTETAANKNDVQTSQNKANDKNNGDENNQDTAKAKTPGGTQAKSGASDKKNVNEAGNQMKSSNLFGQVQNIDDNKITLAVAQKQQRKADAPQGENPQAQPPVQDQQDSKTQPPAQGEKPAGPPPGTGASPELTGETKTITVPDSAKIVTGGRGESQEITIDKIKTGDMLEVFFKDKSSEIEMVRVMQVQ
ncbi:MAG: hypothetical protein ABFD18_07585 [Syntrophomonas sp.]